MAAGKTAESTARAREVDKASHAELNRMRAQPCNSECFDCTALKPGWAVLPHGVFVCIDCAQVHRNIGRHISQTKAINTGTYLWYPHELQVMREIGNGRALRALRGAPSKPSRDASPAEKEAYARAKYEERRWGPHYDAAGIAPGAEPTLNAAVAPAAAPSAAPQPMCVKPKVGMAHAKRLPTATPARPEPAVGDLIGDLISLDALPTPVPAAAAPVADLWPVSIPSTMTSLSAGSLSERERSLDWAVWEEPAAIKAAAAPASNKNEGWAVWEEEQRGIAAAQEEKRAAGWGTKKAAVLSQFGQFAGYPQQANSFQQPQPWDAPMDSPAHFFARYGL
uniref:Arf-GAP domain-containing protein n=1 Tax=Prymnesium polylepis TaxID=72548 RepID=A0A7S4MI83_9EUKA